MANADSPVYPISTPYGTVHLCVRGSDEVSVYTERKDGEDAPLTINGVAYRLHGYLWVLPDGSLDRMRTGPGGIPEYLDGWNLKRVDQWDALATPAARKAFDTKVVPLVEAFIQNNPDILREGEIARRREFLGRRKAEIEALDAKRAILVKDAAVLAEQIALLKGGLALPAGTDRCRNCFSVATRQTYGYDKKQHNFHCATCGRETKILP